MAESAYRFNRRFRLREMLPRPARAMMLCKPHAEPVLRMASKQLIAGCSDEVLTRAGI